MKSLMQYQCKTAIVLGLSVPMSMGGNYRYLKKSRLLKSCYVPATSAASSKFIFVATTNSTNKIGSTCHLSVFLS
jgi:hypothetical protein